MLAAAWDTPYNIVYLVHVVAVILGTGMAFMAPIMAVKARRDGGRPMQTILDDCAASIIFPSLLIAGIAGGALVGMSGDVYDFQQSWLAIAGVLWIVILVLAAAIYPPSWLRVFNVSDERRKMLGGMMHLSLAVMLVVMTWKFGTRV